MVRDQLRHRAGEGRPAGEELEQDAAERVDVARVVRVGGGAALLGRHVVRRAEHHAGLCVGAGGGVRRGGLLRDAEVEDLRALADGERKVLHEHDVVGLEIAVNDAEVVRGLQRVRDLATDLHRDGGRESTDPREPLRQGLPDEQLHDDERGAIGRRVGARDLAALVNGDDARMYELRQRSRLLQEAANHIGVRAVMRMEEFDRELAIEVDVPRHPQNTEATLGECADQLILPDPQPNLEDIRPGHTTSIARKPAHSLVVS